MFSERLSLLRREKNISQRQAAKELGISQALLSHYENGLREPRLEFISTVCDYYGVSADYILGRTDSPDEGRELERLQRSRQDLLSITERLRALADYADKITTG